MQCKHPGQGTRLVAVDVPWHTGSRQWWKWPSRALCGKKRNVLGRGYAGQKDCCARNAVPLVAFSARQSVLFCLGAPPFPAASQNSTTPVESGEDGPHGRTRMSRQVSFNNHVVSYTVPSIICRPSSAMCAVPSPSLEIGATDPAVRVFCGLSV